MSEMREILFRGKRKDNGEWVYGAYGSHTSLDAMIIDRPYPTSNSDLSALNFWTVNPATVGQYTGLTDKNGTKIFEGDIIQFLNYDNEIGHKGIVYWDSGAFWIDCTETEGDEGICLLNAAPTKLCAIVIGNIHDGDFDNGKGSE